MSKITDEYDSYLDQHISNVQNAYAWLKSHMKELFKNVDTTALDKQIKNHDHSKWGDEEYMPYANYFYGKKTKAVKDEFDKAWLHHQHENAHHPQYWILHNDEDGVAYIDMPIEYIIEMICDWWSFSFKSKNLYEIFDWYEKQNFEFSDATRKTVDKILKQLNTAISQAELDEVDKNNKM